MPRTEVYITADICCTGVEVRAADAPEQHLVITLPAELGLSDRLAGEIRSWQQWFDEVGSLAGPDGIWKSLGDEFDEVGYGLAERVAAELGPAYRVMYGPQGGWCLSIGRGQCILVQA